MVTQNKVLGRFRKSFLSLFEQLNGIRQAPYDRAEVTLQVQERLIKRIFYIENRIRILKAEVADLHDDAEEILSQVDEYRSVLSLYKKVGDSIAYIYMDRFDIKPFSHGHSSGFISGKSGFKLELKIIRAVTKKGFPCLLADLTNVLNHGDVLIFSEEAKPQVIEVKSGRLDQRGRRQLKRLRDLHEFLNEDFTFNFFGKRQSVFRREGPYPVYDHTEQLSCMIKKILPRGSCYEDIEPGLRYNIETDYTEDSLESSIAGIREPIVYFHNVGKFDTPKMPYTPQILALREPHTIWEFYQGKLLIFVYVDFEFVQKSFAKAGYGIRESDNELVYEITHPEIENCQISKEFFGRVGFEFLSLSWMIDVGISLANRVRGHSVI